MFECVKLKMFECVCVYVYVVVYVCVCVCICGCVGRGRVYVIVGGNTSLCPSLSHSKVGHAPTVSTSVITGSPNRSAI